MFSIWLHGVFKVTSRWLRKCLEAVSRRIRSDSTALTWSEIASECFSGWLHGVVERVSGWLQVRIRSEEQEPRVRDMDALRRQYRMQITRCTFMHPPVARCSYTSLSIMHVDTRAST